MTPHVDEVLDGKVDGFSCPVVEMETVIAVFSHGWASKVSFSGKDEHKADVKRFREIDEVWALCARRKPISAQVRILGRFLKPNTFIGLDVFDRSWLGSFQKYKKEAASVPSNWQTLFGSVEPFRGNSSTDYVTGNLVDLDDKQV